PNIPSMVPKTASYALSNFFGPLMLQVGESGGVEALLRSDYNLRQGVYLFNGSATNRWISEHYDLPFSDIGLLMAALR
ncbi:MAG TPA: alanine dehydrogenase, partial [Bacteroidales bacterium]|nr:alanine dehydrogenase [Bacteroidales bacterium]